MTRGEELLIQINGVLTRMQTKMDEMERDLNVLQDRIKTKPPVHQDENVTNEVPPQRYKKGQKRR